jgi:hypothetical protein
VRETLKVDIVRQPFLFPEVEAQILGEIEAWGDEVYWTVGGCDDHGNGAKHDLDDYPCEEVADRSQWKRGTVCVLPGGEILCPETGAVLRGGFCH